MQPTRRRTRRSGYPSRSRTGPRRPRSRAWRWAGKGSTGQRRRNSRRPSARGAGCASHRRSRHRPGRRPGSGTGPGPGRRRPGSGRRWGSAGRGVSWGHDSWCPVLVCKPRALPWAGMERPFGAAVTRGRHRAFWGGTGYCPGPECLIRRRPLARAKGSGRGECPDRPAVAGSGRVPLPGFSIRAHRRPPPGCRPRPPRPLPA